MVNKLLNIAIEIEGLLRIIRDGDPQPETFALLKEKTAELAEKINNLQAAAPMAAAVTKETEESPGKDTLETAMEEILTDQEEKSLIETEIETGAAADQDDILFSFDQEDDIFTDAGEKDDSSEKDKPSSAENESSYIENETFEKEATPIVKEAPKAKQAAQPVNLKSKFSLNDRFLYSRELFDGDMKMFDSTLNFIQGIDDFSVIEEYFYNELEWDAQDSTVASFMDILRPNFKN